MHKWKSLILGAFIACVALFAQVFIDVICEIFLHIPYLPQYNSDAPIHIILPSMLTAASIEELFRFSVIKWRVIHYTSRNLSSIITHGTLLGLGFGFVELLLLYARDFNTFVLSPFILYPFCIHVFLSIFFLFILNRYAKNIPLMTISVVFTILIHTLGNIAIFMTS